MSKKWCKDNNDKLKWHIMNKFQNADRKYLLLHKRNALGEQKQRFPLPSNVITFLMTWEPSDCLL